uniref:Uncharacterized protein n=1 Tax=Anguilla anguilla TaxID=7936 RepID=A0A0E9S9S5_ANGAN
MFRLFHINPVISLNLHFLFFNVPFPLSPTSTPPQ